MSTTTAIRPLRRLKITRLEQGLTAREMARRVGIHPSYVSRLERGEIRSWPRFRQRAAEALGVPESWLFADERA